LPDARKILWAQHPAGSAQHLPAWANCSHAASKTTYGNGGKLSEINLKVNRKNKSASNHKTIKKNSKSKGMSDDIVADNNLKET
jgi:hypothetical protein